MARLNPMLDIGGGIQDPVFADPNAKLNYDSPGVSTYSPQTGYTPPSGNWIGQFPAPVDYGSQPQAPSIGGGSLYQPGYTTGGDTGGGGSAAPARPDYGSMDNSALGGYDSAFNDQQDMYSAKLKKYIADYDAQTGGKTWGQDASGFDLKNLGGSMGNDYTMASQGIARNKDLGLRGLSEDFANRGLINSGLYNQDYGQSQAQYDRQGQNLDQGTRNQLQTLNFNRGNMESDNQANIAAARRDALARLSQSQTL